MDRDLSQDRLYQFVAASLVVHLLLWATMLHFEAPKISISTPIDVRYVTKDETKRPKRGYLIPDQDKLTEAVDKLNDQIDRLASSTRRAREEQQASRLGQNQNRAYRAGTPEQSAQASQAERHAKTNPVAADQNGSVPVVEAGIDRPMNSSTGQSDSSTRVQLSDSSISSYIPQVKQGRFTALNANQFENYTFYARINEQIRNRWVQNIRTFLSNISPAGLDKLSVRDQVTELEVLLDPHGNFQDVVFYKKADHPDLDTAAGAAMELAAPFLNPPKSLVEKDGYIHLRYSFAILLTPQYFASPRGDN